MPGGPGFAGAAEIELPTRIDRVTVYPDGAVVTRLGRAELLQGASQQLDGEQALIRWLAEQIEEHTPDKDPEPSAATRIAEVGKRSTSSFIAAPGPSARRG